MKNKSSPCLVIVHSYHHKNTEKVAQTIAHVLNAEIKHIEDNNLQDFNLEEIQTYELVGFGAGIDSGKHYKPILTVAQALPVVKDKKAFIFSTSAIMGKDKVEKDHATLRKILITKGYTIVDEVACKGFNTNSFLKYFGGMNKGRPNAEDLKEIESFAKTLNQYIS